MGPPPDLTDFPELDTDAEDDEVVLKKYVPKSKQSKTVPKPNSLQQRMLAISGQNIDDFMKEMENVHKKKVAAGRMADNDNNSNEEGEKKVKSEDEEEDRTDLSESSDNTDDEEDSDSSRRKRKDSTSTVPVPAAPVAAAAAAAPIPMPLNMPGMAGQPHMHVAGPPVPPLGGIAPPPMMFRPPPRPPGMHAFGIRMPPGPPPGPRPGMPRMGIRIPGPPPGMPPRMAHHKNQQLQNKDSKGVTTITAKPQIR